MNETGALLGSIEIADSVADSTRTHLIKAPDNNPVEITHISALASKN